MTDFWNNPDLLILTGSQMYGTSTESSDRDLRGFVIEPAEYLLSRKTFEQHEELNKEKGIDTVIWGFKKFYGLIERFSPNTTEIIFAPKHCILKASDLGQKLIDNRHIFVSKHAVKPMQGFALSEWKKAVDYFEQYRKLGNQRKEHIAQFGYSIKNAYHAIRLLGECIELMETGTITFPRPDADILKKIRYGEMEIDKIKELYMTMDAQVNEVFQKSSLPEITNKEVIEQFYYEMIERSLKKFVNSVYRN